MTLGNCIINACAVGFSIVTIRVTYYILRDGSALMFEHFRWLLPLEIILLTGVAGLAIYNIINAVRRRNKNG